MKYLLVLTIVILTLGGGTALAQEASAPVATEGPTEAEEPQEVLEDIQPEDLGVSDPNILPDSPFYFLKEWGRNIQSFLTFDPVKKAQLKEKFTNEKLIEVKKMVEQKKTWKRVGKAIKNYQVELEEAKQVAEKIRERAEENEQVGKFLDKFILHQALHQQILQKLETQVPEETFQKIQQAREQHMEKFGEVMNKLEENKEQLQERLEKNLKEQNAVGILKELEEKVPEEAKNAIRRAKENIIKMEKMEWIQLQEQEQEQTEVKPAPIPGKTIQQQKGAQACIQVVTYAKSPEGLCKEFPTPCDVPENWEKVEECPTNTGLFQQKIIKPIKGLFFEAKTEMQKGAK
jgi:hypothetical protein